MHRTEVRFAENEAKETEEYRERERGRWERKGIGSDTESHTASGLRKEQRGKSGENRRQRRELSPGSILVTPLSVPAAVFVRPVLSGPP